MAVRSLAQSTLRQNPQINSMLAGYQPNAFHHLETVRLGGNAASVEFTNLARYADYQHLQIRMTGKTSRGTFQDDPIIIQFNSDTNTASYRYHKLATTGSTPFSETESYIFTLASTVLPTNAFGAIVADILDPFDSTKNTTVRALGGAGTIVGLGSMLWMNTSSVSSIRIASYTGSNIFAGSRFSLYGIKARV